MFHVGAWALGALRAAEQGLPQPPDGVPRWEEIAAAVFDVQAARWDNETCGGGLRWQIFTFNKGYDYKNAESQGMFFLLAARLARLTGNQTYVDWATTSYEWTEKVGLIGKEGQVYDGTLVESDCSEISKLQWSYNNAAFLYGSAIMANLVSTCPFFGSSQAFFPTNMYCTHRTIADIFFRPPTTPTHLG